MFTLRNTPFDAGDDAEEFLLKTQSDAQEMTRMLKFLNAHRNRLTKYTLFKPLAVIHNMGFCSYADKTLAGYTQTLLPARLNNYSAFRNVSQTTEFPRLHHVVVFDLVESRIEICRAEKDGSANFNHVKSIWIEHDGDGSTAHIEIKLPNGKYIINRQQLVDTFINYVTAIQHLIKANFQAERTYLRAHKETAKIAETQAKIDRQKLSGVKPSWKQAMTQPSLDQILKHNREYNLAHK